MKTLAFIGSDKNAGKTTCLNFVCSRLRIDHTLCLTSIGLNGELVDTYEGHQKPQIKLLPGDFFITASEHIKNLMGRIRIQHLFSWPNFKKNFVLAQVLTPLYPILEGPNSKAELLQLKQTLQLHDKIDFLMIDGSIDRQVIAHPDLCDSFYFALLLTERSEQMRKAINLVTPLNFPTCNQQAAQLIKKFSPAKSLLFSASKLLYRSDLIPFEDTLLKHHVDQFYQQKLFLYLNGALSHSLANFLAPFQNLTVILDNFTLYQNICLSFARTFSPQLELFHPLNLEKIFLRQQTKTHFLPHIKTPIHNLYREDPDEIRIAPRCCSQ